MSHIVWVDEDERFWLPERRLLEALGHTVELYSNASSAYSALTVDKLDNINLLILDVMLLPGNDDINFSSAETEDGTVTGLVLARRLVQLDPSIGARTLFYSRASNSSLIDKIKLVAKEIGARYLAKSGQRQGIYFIEYLKENGYVNSVLD